MSDYDFSHSDVDYAIDAIKLRDDGFAIFKRLTVAITPSLSSAARADLTLNVGSSSFEFSDATYRSVFGSGELVWSNTGLTWFEHQSVSLTITANVLSLTLDEIAGDDVVNVAEKAAGFVITGATGMESGVAVSVTVGSQSPLTTTSDSNGAWSVSVPPEASYITGTSVSVSVTASKTGFTAPSAVTRTLTVDLAAPTVSWTAPGSLTVGEAITAVTPSTSDTDIASYSATDLPPGLTIDSGTGAIGGTPTAADADPATATATVTDAAGNPATVDIVFPMVAKGDQTLSGFKYSAASVTYGDTAPSLTAPGGAEGALSYTATPSMVCSVVSGTGALTIAGVGECVITATAAATTNYKEATAAFTVTVQPVGTLALTLDAIAGDDVVNVAEKAAGFAITGATGSESGVTVSVTVGSQSPLTATTDGAGAWTVMVPANAAYITGTSVGVSVSASKTGFTPPAAVTRSLGVDLVVPTAPTYTAPGSLTVGEAITALSPSGGSDIDAYGATGLPPGLTINSGTGAIGGTPTAADADTSTATVTVTDAAGNPDTVSVTFPMVAKGDQELSGFKYSAATVTFGDTAPTVTVPTGAVGTLSYTATPSTVCMVNASSGALTIVAVGSCVVTARAASTTNYNEGTAEFTVTVQDTLALNLDVIATDDVVNIAEKTAGFAISGDTGTESGVSVSVTVGSGSPLTATSADDNGTATWSVSVPPEAAYITGTGVSVSVSASKTGFTSPGDVTRSLTVDLVAPTAPTYTAPGSLQVGAAITAMTPLGGSGIDEYRATGLPSGLTINTTTGAISGTPDTADGDASTATVTVTDAAGNPSTVDIAFPMVAKGEQVLSGFAYDPATVTYGDTAPSLTAPMGAVGTLSYTATPSTVCTVNATTGALTIAGVGECVITATAAATTNYKEATAAFTVTVQPVGTLSLTLDEIAGDDVVNVSEKAAGFAITGATGTESGVTVSVTVGSQSPLTATTDGAGAWTVSVPPAAAYITGTSVGVSVSASKTGFTPPDAVTRSLGVDLVVPSVSWTAPSSLQVGVAIGAMNPSTSDTDIASYSATGLPPGLTIDSGTGAIGGTPTAAEADTSTATVTVTDAAGNPSEESITFPMVAKGEQVLSGFKYSAETVTYGDTAPSLTEPTGAEGALSYTAMPSTVCSVVSGTGALTIEGVGECVITARAAATTNYKEATAAFTVTVQPVGTLSLTLDAIAGDDVVNVSEKTAGFAITGATGTESGVSVSVTVGSQSPLTATTDGAGVWSVSVPANAAYITGTSVSVSVSASKTGYTPPDAVTRSLGVDLVVPTAPAYTAPGSLTVGVAITALSPSGGSDIDAYGATGLPPGLTINSGTGAIGGTPTTADADPSTATVTVTDAAGNPATVDIVFPMVTKGDQTLSGFKYSAETVTYGDTAPSLTVPGGAEGALSYTATPSMVCSVNATTGALTIAGVGECVITATAAATTNYKEATAAFTVTVEPVGTLALTLDTIAGDDVVNVSEKAAGFAITGATGTESGVSVSVTVGSQSPLTATTDGAGVWSVSVPANAAYITGTSVGVSVSASKTGHTSPDAVTRSLGVDLVVPTAPAYTAPGSLTVGEAITALSPSGGSDIDAYSATDLPPGLTINSGTGAIGGTPTAAEADPSTATVTVTDAADNPATVDIVFPMVAKGEQVLSGFKYSAETVAYGDTAPSLTAPMGAEGALSYTATPSTVCTVNATTGALTIEGLGECVITARAADTTNYNEATAAFTLTVEPAVSVTAPSSQVLERAGEVLFSLVRTGSTEAALTVSVLVTQEGSVLASAGDYTSAVEVEIGAGAESATLTVAVDDDGTAEMLSGAPAGVAGRVTAAVQSGTGYTVSDDAGSATVSVLDDNDQRTDLLYYELLNPELPGQGGRVSLVGRVFDMWFRFPGTSAPATFTSTSILDAIQVEHGSASNLRCQLVGSTAYVDCTSTSYSNRLHYFFTVTVDTNAYTGAQGQVTVSVDDDVITGGNRGAQRTFTVDLVPLTVTLTGPASQPVNGDFNVAIEFSKSVMLTAGNLELNPPWQLNKSDVKVDRGLVQSVTGSGKNYSARIKASSSAEYEHRIWIPANAVRDSEHGNGNVASGELKVRVDTLAPTLAIAGPEETPRGPFEATFTFSEPVSGFAEDDITVSGAALVAGSLAPHTETANVWTAHIEPPMAPTTDMVTVSVRAGAVTDAASNGNAAKSATVSFDDTPLALTLATIAGDDTVNIAEKTAGFAISGATGTESGVTVSVTVGTQSPLSATSDDDGVWSVSVPVNAAYITGTSVGVSVSASKAGFTSPDAVTRSLGVDLVMPTAPTYTAPGSLTVGEAITALSPSGGSDIDAYSATDLPPGLTIDSGTGAIGGTPTAAEADTSTSTVTVTDAAGNPAEVSITFPMVAKGEQVLSGFKYSAETVTYGDTAPSLTAPMGAVGALSYTTTSAAVCTVAETSGALTIVGAGACVVTATAASTANYNEATAQFTVTVQDTLSLTLDAIAGDDVVNVSEKAAGFAITGATGTESGVSVTVTVGTTELTATSASADPATWSVSVPPGASYITGTGVSVSVTASKSGFTSPGAVTRSLGVDLVVPTAPTYTAPGSLTVGEAITALSPSGGSDIDAYGATGLPPGLTIDSDTGAIGGTPTAADADTSTSTVTVTDAAGNPAEVSITFPMVAKGEQVLSGFKYSAETVTYGDPAPSPTAPMGAEGALSYTATPSTVCTVNATTGALTIVEAGECVISANAAATTNYNEATAAFTVTVQPAGTLGLTLDAIAGDDVVNVAEKVAGFAITGATGTESGVTVNVTVGSGSPLTATTGGAGAWTVMVPANAAYITGTSVGVSVSASKTGFTPPSDVTRSLTVDLAPPSVSWTAPGSLQVGVAITAMSPSTSDTDIASYSATGLPSGLTIDSGTGAIGGTPTAAEADPATVTVTVTDAAGNPATVDIVFPMVAKGEQVLSGFKYSAETVTYGDTAPSLTAPGGAEGTLSYTATPSTVCSVNATTGALTIVGAGECVVTVTAASTANYNEAMVTFMVTVQPAGTLSLTLDAIAGDDVVNVSEKAAGFAITGATGSESGVTVSVTVGSQSPLTATTDGAGAWTVMVPANAAYITGTSVGVSVSASKTGFTPPGAVTRSLGVDLVVPTAPAYTAPGSLTVGEAITALSPSGGSDIDAYGATDLPPGLTIASGTGAIGGTPTTANATATTATVTVTDAAGNPATVDIVFPMVAKGEQVLSGFKYSAETVTFGDTAPSLTEPTGAVGTLSYTATPSTVCTVNATTGALTLVGVGSCVVTARAASTSNYNEATAEFTVTVQATLALTVDAIATDDTVNIAEKTAGFAISGATGTESGVSVSVTIGTQSPLTATSDGNGAWSVMVPADAAYITGTSVSISVSASKTGFTPPSDVTRSLTVDLTAPTAPTYTAPASLNVGEAITAMSPSGGSGIDEYGATGLPSGFDIDATTGAISGTPDTADENTANATVTVTDAAGNPDTVSITFPAVDKGDQTLTGFAYNPASVTFGDTAPAVTTPNGARTTVAYTATPSTVCTVASATGALTLVGAGSCVVTATAESNANYNQATAMFTVTVQAAGTLALNLATIAGDDTVNIAEKTAGFTISGDTGSQGGVSVSVTVGSQSPLSATSATADPATWSVSVPPDAAYITGTSVSITVSASKAGFTPPSDVTRSLTVDLTAPTAPTYTAPGSLKVGEAITAMSPSGGGGIDAYSATGLPSGLGIDSTTGAISGTPDTAGAAASATVTVTDAAGNPDTVSISFPAVDKGDQTLTGFAYNPASVTFGATAPTLTAPTGAQTTLAYSATPSTVCTVASSTGALTLVGVGSCVVTATAESTANYNEATAMFTVTVQAAGTLVLNLDTIAGDGTVNVAEKTAGFTISGDTGSEGGVSVSVTVGSQSPLTTTSAAADPATWSVSVPPNAAYITGTSVSISVSASKTGFTPPSDVTRSLTVDLTAPTAPTYTAPGSLKVGEAITAMSPSGGSGIDAYSATGLPSGLGIDGTTGAISGTPDTADENTATATVTVTDAAGNPDTVSISFPAVDKGDQTLTGFAYNPASVTFGATAPAVTAPTGARTTVAYTATPATVCTVASSTGALTLVGAGSCVVTATAESNANYNEATATFTVTVQAAGTLALNLATIAGDDTVNVAEKTAGFTISGDTGSQGGVSVTVTVGSTNLSATSAATGAWSVSVPPNAAYITGTSVSISVSASKAGYTPPSDVTRTLTVDLTAPTAPTYTAPGSLKVGEAITAMSPSEGSGIDEYSATGLPSGLDIDGTTGAISGTPDTAGAAATATVTVTDAAGNPDTVSISFPAVDKGDQTLTGFAYNPASVTFGATAPAVTAPTGARTTVAYTATPATVCTVASSTGALTLVGAGSCVVTATAASNANYNEATAEFTVTVQDTLALTVDAIATDDTVNIAEKTAGFAISGATGTESGVSVTVTVGTTDLTATSAAADPATWSVMVPANAAYITGTSVSVSVSASKTGFTSPSAVTRTLAVDLAAPSVSYTAPGSLEVGVAMTAVTPSTSDTDIDAYSASGLPSGLAIDTGTGAISGTPDTAEANTSTATVTVTDTAGNPAEVSITFPMVAKGEQVLSGFKYSAETVTFGDTAPSLTEPTGAVGTLSYTATPSTVCTVNATTGALTLVGVGSCVVTARAASTSNYNEATAEFTVTVQATLALTVDAIATDDTVNIVEKTAGFAISGATGTESGVSVSVTIGTQSPLTATSDGNGAWSVMVPADAAYITGTSVSISVSASKTGFTPPSDVTRSLTVDLTAPTAPTYTAPGSLKVGEAITAMSPSGGSGIDAYSATGLPSGLDIDATTGAISGTPDTAGAAANATVTVTDAAGNPDTVSITFPAVDKGDQTLTGFAYNPASVTFGDTAPAVTTPNGARTTVAYTATPSTVCTVASATGALTLVGAGSCVVTATAESNANYNQATAMFTVTVQAAGTLALNLATIAGDDTVNIAEKTAGFTISGDTGSQGGVSVTVTVGSTNLSATSATADPATWSVSVPPDAAYITGTSVSISVSASKIGFTPPSDVTRSLTVDLTAPTAPTYTAPGSLKVGETITAMSPSGGSGIDGYGATGLPSGLVIDAGTGDISGTPDAADEDTANATVTVTDTAGNPAEVSITFPMVAKGEQVLSGFKYSATTATLESTAPTVTVPTGAQGALSYTATPATVCTVNSTTGALTLVGVGSCVVTARAASTSNYNEATAEFTVTVQATLALTVDAIATDDTVNIAEKTAGFAISGATGSEAAVSVTVTVGTTDLTATSAAADPATWSVGVPASAAYITGTSVSVSVSASKTGFTSPSAVTRTLAVDLAAPSVSYTAPGSLEVGVAMTAVTPSTSDTDIDAYSASGLPSGLAIDTGTGAISGTPDTAEANTANATVTVTDTAGNPADVSLTFPMVAKGDQTLSGFKYSATTATLGSTAPTVTVPTGAQGALSYTATPATVCTVNSTTGALTLVGVGSCVVTARAASTANYNEATAEFTVTVQATLALTVDAIATDNVANVAEKTAGFAISGATGTESGVSVTVTVGTTDLTATSAAADPATWSVSVPANAAYITGTSVEVSVSASKAGFTSPSAVTRTLAVDLAAPSVSYTAPGSLQVGVAITAVTPSTSDTDIDAYSASGLPSGLAIDTGTGAISGTPDAADEDTSTATVTVTDTADNPAEVSITFPMVAKGEQVLSGFKYSATTATLGSTAPTVTVPTGAQGALSYTATPATVCTVNSTTGALTLVGVGSCVVTARAASTANYNEGTAEFAVTVQATLALTVDAIATDNVVNVAEKTAGFAISGATGTESGVSVTVTVGTTDLTATSAAADPATWSVSVPASAAYITGPSVSVSVSVSKTGFTSPSAVTRALTVDLTAPTASTYTAPASLKVGEAITAMSPSGGSGIDRYGATGLPSGLVIDAGTGDISGTPDTAGGAANATVTVTDTAGNPDTVSISFPAVDKGDQTLTGFAYSPASVTFGDTAPAVTAPTGAQTTLAYTATPATVCTVNASSGALTIVGVGSCVVTATAESTANYNQATAMFTVTVQAAGTLVLNLDTIAGDDTVNVAEKTAGFTISGDTGSEGGVSVTVTVGSTSLTAISAAADPATWSVSVPPAASYITESSVSVSVSAGKTGFTSPSAVTRTLTVDLTAPTAPTYTAPASLKVGEAITAMSPSGGSGIDRYGATGLPSGFVIDAGTGDISGTPDTAGAAASATVTVTDTAGNPATVSISFPAVDKGDQTLTGFAYNPASVTFGATAPTLTAATGAQTTLAYSATPSTVCTVASSTGALTLVGVGSCVVTATAESTANYNEATAMFTVTVQAAGTLVLNLDTIAGDDTVNVAEKTAGFTISGDTGSEGGVSVTVTVGSTNLTATSAAADPATWSVSVPPAASYITESSVSVSVSAGKTGFTSPSAVTRTLTVDLTAPTAPTYTALVSLKVGEAITAMSPSGGSGIDGYGATGLQSGLVIDAGTGDISGTPDTAGAAASATVTVTDTAGNSDTVSISFPAVDMGDQTLTGFAYSPGTVTFGATAPAVTAPTGARTTLAYTATPSTVCTVNSTTGALTIVGVGSCVVTATAESTANYNQATAMFTVTVQAAGTVTVSVAAANAVEGAAVEFTATLSGAVGSNVVLAWGTADGTATAGADYTAVTGGTLTVSAGTTSGTFSVTTREDALAEGDETFTVALAASGVPPPEVSLGTATATGTIGDDDPLTAAVSVASEVIEGEAAEFTVTLTGGTSTAPVEVSYEVGGTATAGTDYTAPSEPLTLTLAAGATTGTIRIDTLNDGVPDPGETLGVTLGGASTTKGTVAVDAAAATATTVLVGIATGTGPIEDGEELVVSVAAVARSVEEGEAAEFTVTLTGGTSTAPVEVSYEVGGTATTGTDYTAPAAPATLTIGAGESSATIRIDTIADGVPDPGETLVVSLRGARTTEGTVTVDPSAASATSTIADAGTATVSMAVESAAEGAMAQFGRMAGVLVVDVVDTRLEGGAGSDVQVGGLALRSGPAGLAPEGPGPAGRESGLGGPGWRDRSLDRSRSMSARDLLLRSSFRASTGGEPGGRAWTAWARAAVSGFESTADGVRMDGNVTSGFLGLDVSTGRWLAGAALSYGAGEGTFAFAPAPDATPAEGTVESTLTSIYPYARARLNERVSMWGILGFGRGKLALSEKGEAGTNRYLTRIGMRMGALGVRGTVLSAAKTGGLELGLRSDALLVGMRSDAVEGLAAPEADVSRLRLLVDGSREFETDDGAKLTTRLDLGVRRDGGDARSGLGVEVGAGLRYAGGGVTIEGSLRRLVVHEESDYREWGASGSVRIDPRASGRGLSLTVAPAWGAVSGVAERLWTVRDASGLARGADFEAAGRLDAELGYGLRGPGGLGVVTPYEGLTVSDGGSRRLRAGARWDVATGATLGFEASRAEGRGGAAPVNALTVRAELRF